jgi:apolipoprotein N-acyltransferase
MRSVPAKLWVFSIGSAVLQALPFPVAGPVPLWRRAFCWFCLVPLLLALLGKDSEGKKIGPKQAALLGYGCGVVWYAANCYWIYQTMYLYGGIPKVPSFGILVLFALYLGLYHALFAWAVAIVHRSYSAVIALYAVPFLWVALEFARTRITGFPWDLLGYTQVDNFALTALAPLGGVMLLSFAIAAVNAMFAAGFYGFPAIRRWQVTAMAVAVAVLLQAGSLVPPVTDAATSSAVLLQENLSVGAEARQSLRLTLPQEFVSFGALSRKSMMEAQSKPNLIVWPEAPADFNTADPMFRSTLSNLARSTDTPVIAGSLGVDYDSTAERGYHEYGSAAVFDHDGNYIGRYDKVHLVPWGEYVPFKDLFSFAGKLTANVGDLEPGRKHTLFPINGHKFGIFICYESIFGDEVRDFVKNGADVLVNISDDGWYGDTGAPWQHLDMERMRAIENHRWILRDTNTGVTTSIDAHGRGDFTTPRHVREAFNFPFAYSSKKTFYTLHGDWFAWLCVAVTLLLLAATKLRPQVTRSGKVH